MSDDVEIQQNVDDQAETKAPSEIDALRAEISELKNDLSSVINNKNDILNEKKLQQKQLREAEEERMRKKGDFEKLLKSSEASRNELEQKLATQMASISAAKIKSVALQAAQQISDGGKVKFLAREIEDRLKDIEGDVRILDKSGNPTISSIDDLLNEMKSSGDYDDLLTGTKSSGGGASGSDGSAGANKMKRSAFDKQDSNSKMKFIKDGGQVSD